MAEEEAMIKWFPEIDKNSVSVVGGKGANLGEIYNLGIPVPPGFVITARAYSHFIKENNLDEKISNLLKEIKYEDTAQLDKIAEEIRNLITNGKIPKDLTEEILESYENLGAKPSREGGSVEDILGENEEIPVAVRSSSTAEDLAEASFAGQQDSFVDVKGKENLLNAVRKCFASLFTSRAIYYRNKKGFSNKKTRLAVIIQKMINSEKSGVVFSKDPTYQNENVIIEAVFGLGEGIVSGQITPDKYIISRDMEILSKKINKKKIAIGSRNGEKIKVNLKEEVSNSSVLKDYEIKNLAEIALNLEKHYKMPQDIEFAIASGEISIVQTRAITTVKKAISESEKKELKGEIILNGIAASPGIESGKIRIVKKSEDLEKVKQGDVLVTKMTNPDMVVTMQRASAIVTDEGGMTSHAAIVSREMGIPSVVGTEEATTKLKENEIITVDGYTGKVYKGKISGEVKEKIQPVTAKTRTIIKVIIDLPSFADRASKTGLKEVGLLRLEGIIAESGKHPNYFLKQKKIKDYEELIFRGVEKIAGYFDSLWVRSSDIRSDEFRELESSPENKEANPMLGMHGIRYSLKHPEIFKAELNALKRVSEKGKKIGLLFPQVISVEDVKSVKKILSEIKFPEGKIGVMVETPASVQIIRNLCEEGIDFISFGTNDLTQYTLAIDRGNEQVQEIYNEMNPAVLNQLEYVIRTCKKYNVKTSICGQAGSKKPMVKFLVEKGIDSISVNPDAAKEISDYVQSIERSVSGHSSNSNNQKRKFNK